jgi:hypothetical protein
MVMNSNTPFPTQFLYQKYNNQRAFEEYATWFWAHNLL